MDLMDMIFEAVGELLEDRFQNNVKRISETYENKKACIDENFKEKFRNVLKKAIKLQNENRKRPIEYIVISFLRTHMMMDRNDVRIDLYDNTYFMDDMEASGYWDVDFVFPHLNDDISGIEGQMKSLGMDVEPQDFEKLKIDHGENYAKLIYGYLLENISMITQMDEYLEMRKTDGIKIMFGEYMGKSEIVYGNFDNAENGG